MDLENNSARTLFDIAMHAEKLRQYTHADRIFSKAKSISENSKWSQTPEYACTLVKYADLCIENSRLDNAEIFLREALKIFCERFGQDHINTALTMRNLAEVLKQQGKTADANQLLNCASSSLARYKHESKS